MKTYLLLAFTTLLSSSILAQNSPELVKDINTAANSSNPEDLLVVGDWMYFAGTDGAHGMELWRTDGTSTGTALVVDIVPGATGSKPANFFKFGKTLLFNANGTELWKSDGTEKGTKKIGSSALSEGTEANGYFFFPAVGPDGVELWRTDGTDTGTYVIKDIYPTSISSFPRDFTAVGNTLFFTANTPNEGRELWKSNGTTKGTMLVKDTYTGTAAFVRDLVAYNGLLYFSGNDGVDGLELWQSDGTAIGTKVAVDIVSGSGGSFPASLVNSGKWLYFAASDATNGRELWKSDGTVTGTTLVKDLDPFGNTSPANLVGTNDKVFFLADIDKGRELYFSDGTDAGTKLTRDLFLAQTDAFITQMTPVGDTLFFVAHSSPHYQNYELHMSTGSLGSTRMVKDIVPGPTASKPTNLTAFKGKLYFSVDDSIKGNELWVSDGSSAGTTLFKDVYAGTESSYINSLVSYTNGVAFTPYNGTFGREMWTSKGTNASTNIIKDIETGSASSSPKLLTSAGDLVYSYLSNGLGNGELYYTDGTDAGTDYHRVSSATDYLSNFVPIDDVLFFARRSSFNDEIWKFEAGSARLVRKINPNGLGAKVDDFVNVEGTLYFTADDGNTSGREVWKTDGSLAGTVLLKDIYSGSKDANPLNLTASGSNLYFTADDGNKGRELWISQGTESSTKMVLDFNKTGGTSISALHGDGNGNLYFSANDATYGNELWLTDGTETGSTLLLDINSGTESSLPNSFVNTSEKTYFIADDGQHGAELWCTDGTEKGTYLVKDIQSGIKGSGIDYLTPVRDKVYFTADDGSHGTELWVSDGTEKGTELVNDLWKGTEGSLPKLLTLHNDTLYFIANTLNYGEELWAMFTNCLAPDFSSAPSCVGDSAPFANFSDSLGLDNISYSWIVDGGAAIDNSELKYKFEKPGNYPVTLIMKTPDCQAEVSKIHVVDSLPISTFEIEEDTLCFKGHSFILNSTVTDPNKDYSYQWAFSDDTKNNNTSVKKSFWKAGRWQIDFTVVNGTCKSTSSQEVLAVAPPIIASIDGKDITKTAVDTYSVANHDGSTYEWRIEQGSQTSGGTSNEIYVRWDTTEDKGLIYVVETNEFGCKGTEKSKQVILDFTSSIAEEPLNYFRLFPNPAKGEVRIALNYFKNERQELSIYNNLGQLVFSQPWNQQDVAVKTIKLDGLTSGIYQVVLNNNSGKFVSSLMVQD